MPFTSIIVGLLLIAIGVVGYIHGMMNEKASVTALIPAFFGIVIALLGIIANAKESLRKHLMHAAVVVGLIGFVVPFGRVMSKISEFTLSAAVVSQLTMAAVCLVFVVLAVRSFITARKSEPPA